MRKTKIICTLGPSTDKPEVLEKLIEAGMNVARMNFSHGDYSEHEERLKNLRSVSNKMGLPIAVLLDTRGPEIRIEEFKNGQIELVENQTFILTTRQVPGNDRIVSVSYEKLHKDLRPGVRVLIDDGLVELVVEDIRDQDIICRVLNSGVLSNRKSVNIPNEKIRQPYLSTKDRKDILFGIRHDVDFIAASFVRTPEDVREIRQLLDENGGKDIHIIAKIENQEGYVNAREILNCSNGLMIARGDMGVEVPLEDLPGIQKDLIKSCYRAGKISITATQMLDSMIRNPRPTRAEITDVANAIYDGTSAIMLSGETAIGLYPVESVETMSRIAHATEKNVKYKELFDEVKMELERTITNAIGHAACMTAFDLNVDAIITVSDSGMSARSISKFRPDKPIICTTPNPKTQRQLALSWGIFPIMSEVKESTDELFMHAIERALAEGLIHKGDIVVVTGGARVGVSGSTNILRVDVVG